MGLFLNDFHKYAFFRSNIAVSELSYGQTVQACFKHFFAQHKYLFQNALNIRGL
jgi:hypothetical protein